MTAQGGTAVTPLSPHNERLLNKLFATNSERSLPKPTFISTFKGSGYVILPTLSSVFYLACQKRWSLKVVRHVLPIALLRYLSGTSDPLWHVKELNTRNLIG